MATVRDTRDPTEVLETRATFSNRGDGLEITLSVEGIDRAVFVRLTPAETAGLVRGPVPVQKEFPSAIDAAFHRLWTAAVGTPGYDKAEWKLVNQAVRAHCYGNVKPPGQDPKNRGTPIYPCEYCNQTEKGNTLRDGWYRCNECGEPSK